MSAIDDKDGTGDTGCARSLALSSLYLDRRLRFDLRAEVDAHLSACDDCRGEVAALVALSRRVAALPLEPLADPAALAARVRMRGRPAPPAPSVPRWTRVAAALIASLSLFVAYSIGRYAAALRFEPERERLQSETARLAEEGGRLRSDRDRLLAESLELRRDGDAARSELAVARETIASAPKPAEDATLERAAQSLLSDLALIDRVPQDLRKPLLVSQIRHFGLDAWAARGSPPPAPLIGRLTRALESDDDGELLELQREALAIAPRSHVEPPLPPFAKRGRIDVGETASRLPEREKASLEQLLELKDSWVRGDYAPAVELAREERGAFASGPFESSMKVTVLMSLSDAGHPELAAPVLETLDRAMQDLLTNGAFATSVHVQVRDARDLHKH